MNQKIILDNIIRKEGFDLWATIKPGKVSGFTWYQKWLKQGFHADMKWMENNLDKRSNSTKIMDDCRTIIVLGASYFNRDYKMNEVENNGRALVARYAWGDDYHQVLVKKMATVMTNIALVIASKNTKYKCYADTGPILEKNIAEMAGLGWKGKNSLLINHKIGSYFLIATIFTNLEMDEYKPKLSGGCGSCRRCIDACPTGAILDNKSIDCRKCMSYHTIENRGEIPFEIKKKIGNRIFGCDICQEVCPWNRFAKETSMPELRTKNNRDKLTIEQIKNMDKEEYQRLFKNSAVKRAKCEGLKRNAGRN